MLPKQKYEEVLKHFDHACVIENPFVGREDDLRNIDQAWLSHRIIEIYGLPGVGKSRVAKEFIDRTRKRFECNHECSQNEFQVIHLDIRILQDTYAIYSNICTSLGVPTESLATKTDKWQQHVVDEIGRRTSYFILYFDNAEKIVDGAMRDDVLPLCRKLAEKCSNSKTFFTTTTLILFSQIKTAVLTLELLPLNTSEASVLLKSVAPHADLGQCEEDILKCSEGLPLLIVMIGSELEQDGGLIIPQYMTTMLQRHRLRTLSREFYSKDDRIADVYKGFLERLSKTNCNRLSALEYIPGTFNMSEATELLGNEDDVQTLDQTVIGLRRRSLLRYDPTTRRFDIQGVLRECIQTYIAVNNIPALRARYCKVFTCVMLEIAEQLGTAEYTKALAELTAEHPNLQKLLKEVLFTNEDTYHFVIGVTEKCTDLIEMFLRSDSEKFYDGCLQLADRYGRDEDKAVIHIAVGSLATNLIGDLPRGAAKYESALHVLHVLHVHDTKRITLLKAKVYQRMGWNLHRQGRNEEAVRYFKLSLDISACSGKDFQTLYLQSLNSMGVAHTALGNLENAYNYHFKSLELRKQLRGEDHPCVGATLNNIGIFYYQKGEPEKALNYYVKGLEIKRKGNLPSASLVGSAENVAEPTGIVDSLNNIALAHSDLKQWESSHELLDEAMNILNGQKITLKDSLALTYDTRGKVFMSEGKFQEASDMFEKASEIRKEITLSGIAYFESLLHLAQAKESQGKYYTSLNFTLKLLQLQAKDIKTMPQNSVITECLECIERIFEKIGDEEICLETLGKIQTELMRLENFHVSQQNEQQVVKIRQQLNVLNMKIKRMEFPPVMWT